MKKITLTIIMCFVFIAQIFGQINPVENLFYNGWYEESSMQFTLQWNTPDLPHDNLIGYNVYRGDEFYRFQTDTILYYYIDDVTYLPYFNCPLSFLEDAPFWAHVTAVYNSNQIESIYNDSVKVEGFILRTNKIKSQKPLFYPNPTSGKLFIDHANINRILIYDLQGKIIKNIEPVPQIDISQLPKGVYLVKLITGEKAVVEKIIVE